MEVLERNQKMYDSLLWKLQRDTYCELGPQTKNRNGVSFYTPCNPFSVRQYAQAVVGYFKDCIAPNAPTPIDRNHPVYIFDLAPGTGFFGFLFVKALIELLAPDDLYDIKFCYVMADPSEKNLTYLREHTYLHALVYEKLLDFTHFRYEDHQGSLHLLKSNVTLTPETIVNPIILIGNYFFDLVPQNLFKAQKGLLEEGLLTLSLTAPKKRKKPQLNCLSRLRYKYTYAPVEKVENYFTDFPELNILLKAYSRQFYNLPFLFPTGAFKTIRYFTELSKKRLLFLASDHSECSHPPKMTYPFPLNYSGIIKYFNMLGGISLLETLLEPEIEPHYVGMAAILGGAVEQFPQTQQSFDIEFDHYYPGTYWSICNYSEKEWKNPVPAPWHWRYLCA